MRKLMLMVLVIALCLPNAQARRKKDKAGKVTDHVFVDKKFDYSLKISEGWKYKVQANKSNYRISLIQKNYQIPSDYLDAEDYTQIPKVILWVGETKLGEGPFIDSLLSDSYRSDAKKDILKEFELINDNSAGSGTEREDLVPMGRSTFEIDGHKANLWKGKAKYTKNVALSASSSGGKRVKSAYGGSLIAVKEGDKILVFHMMCEWPYFNPVQAEVMEMINTLKFGKPESEG